MVILNSNNVAVNIPIQIHWQNIIQNNQQSYVTFECNHEQQHEVIVELEERTNLEVHKQ